MSKKSEQDLRYPEQSTEEAIAIAIIVAFASIFGICLALIMFAAIIFTFT